MTAIRFTLAELEASGLNCGPSALAAICGLTLDEVRQCFPGFKGWTNISMMLAALRSTGRRHHEHRRVPATQALDWPRYGLALIQFEGPWTEPCPPSRERWARIDRAKRTHWVGVSRLRLQSGGEDSDAICVWDCNAVDKRTDGWCLADFWSSTIVPALAASYKRATGGWHVAHAIEVSR